MGYKIKSKQEIENRFVSRRQFLIGGGATLALPPLISLMPASVAAAALVPKRRFVVMMGTCGISGSEISPPDQTDLTPVPGALFSASKPLNQFVGPISNLVDSDFASLYPKMNLVQGLSMTGGTYMGHNTSFLSGAHSQFRNPTFGRTLDVVMEKSTSVYPLGDSTPFKAIRLCGGSSYPYSYDTVPVKKVSDWYHGDVALFNALFLNMNGSGADDKLMVDKVHADIQKVQSDPRLSAQDKLIVQEFADGMFDLQSKIANPRTCAKPSPTLQSTGFSYGLLPDGSGWNKTLSSSVMFDNYNLMIKLAFACDLTRIVFIAPERCNTDTTAVLPEHHDAPSATAAANAHKWSLKKLLNLAKMMDATTDTVNGSGTLLDNSLMLFSNEMGDWTTGHSVVNMPVITMGGLGGTINTGHFIDYRQRPLTGGYTPGRPFKQLLQSIMLGMGVPKTEYMKYGDGQGYGEFKIWIKQFGVNIPEAYKAYAGEHNEPLPFYYKG